ncbi:MAG: hypothetical protein OFPI_07280 [Osedax symbiont Rs2]|nr:MAG: hypothetical protein OFPI_07280 [Osedax symbiont Rs2]
MLLLNFLCIDSGFGLAFIFSLVSFCFIGLFFAGEPGFL